MTSIRNSFLLAGLLVAGSTAAQVDTEAPQKLVDYTCWQLLTEPEENRGSTEVFYLGFALGRAGIELADESAYKQAVTEVLSRCRGEPDTKVLDAFDAAIRRG